ncbi:aldo/keto reductase [Pseudarthrobacter sp. P1]|uniref:aldo/keto reductase n=1 Tax=Pseudarthrobacter sp. P1 TaxID=3418418 RepID=UPI003CF7298D
MQETALTTTALAGLRAPISPLVLGTMTFGDTVDAAGAAAMVDTALAAGITVIDTANGYAGGTSEEILAPLLRNAPETVLVATKAGMPHPDAAGHAPLSAAGLRLSLEGSLRRLQRESVDLFYLHQPDRATPLAETMDTLAQLRAEGRISAVGVSNFAAWQIGALNAAADAAGAPRPVAAQQLYNLVARRLDEEYAEFARTTSLHTMVYNPLGGGLLTGKHSFEAAPEGGRFQGSRLAEMYKERYWDQRLFAAIQTLGGIADAAGLPLVELSLRWLLSKPLVDSVLLGGSKAAQLQDNINAASRGPLPADLVAACDAVGLELRGPMPAYNR